MIKTEAYNESKQFLGLTKKNGVKASKLYTQKPLGFFSVSRNLAAYRTNQEGVLELMGANVPRIDYPITILEPARTNLILYSQEFNNASWNKDNCTITANSILAPDGTLTADSIVENNLLGQHGPYQIGRTVASGATVTLSFFVKQNVRRYVLLQDPYTGNGAFFDLQLGIALGTVGTILNKSIQIQSNGWFRCIVTFNASGTLTGGQVMLSQNGTSVSYTGNNSIGAYIWGAQLETGSTATAYIPTTNAPVTVPDVIEAGCPELLVENEATNLVLRSQEFDNASWNKLNATIITNAIVAPDGTTTANKIYPTTSGADRLIEQVPTVLNGVVYTNSIFAKKGEYDWIIMYAVNLQPVYFNINNGTIGNVGTGVSANIENFGNGWYRCIISATSINANGYFYAGSVNANGSSTITSSGTNGNYFWGAQLEQGNKATSYIPTTTAAVTRPADNVRNNTIGYDNEESTIFVRARLNFTTDYQGIATLWDNDDIYNGYITMYYYISGGVRYIAFDTYNGSDTNQYLYTAPSDGVYSIAFAYNTTSGGYKIAINGVLITDDAFPNDLPSYTLLTQTTLGSFLTYFNSRTKGFMYFDSMLDNDSLENLTVQ